MPKLPRKHHEKAGAPVIPSGRIFPSEGTLIRRAHCPVCGAQHGYISRKAPGRSGLVVGRSNYWERPKGLEGTGERPFGIILRTQGRGTMEVVDYFEAVGDTEFFPHVKARLLEGIRDWLKKGLIKKEEI